MSVHRESGQTAGSVDEEREPREFYADAGPPEDTSFNESDEAITRWVIRIIPLTHGMLVGRALGDTGTGLFAGSVLSAIFDLFMGKKSLIRTVLRGMKTYLCPTLAAVARHTANATMRLGLPAPAAWTTMRCGASQFE